MKQVLFILLCLALFAAPTAAAGGDPLEEQLELDKLERAAREYLDGMEISLDSGLDDALGELLDTGTEQMTSVLKKAARSGVLILITVLLCGVAQSLTPKQENMAVVLTGALAVTAIAVADVNSLLGQGREAMEAMGSFTNILLPVTAAVTAATGALTGAAARQMAAALFSNLLTNLIVSLLVPILYGYVAAYVGWTATGNGGLKRTADFLKWLVVTVLTLVLTAFVTYLTLSGVVAGSADATAVKAARFAISGAVPVVGKIISDAAETVLASAGILRGTVGIFGMVVILAICLIPFLQLAAHYLIYKLTAALAATVGEGRICGLVDGIGGAFGLLLGMTGACALLMLITLVSYVTMVAV